jgi:hypothetical protein
MTWRQITPSAVELPRVKDLWFVHYLINVQVEPSTFVKVVKFRRVIQINKMVIGNPAKS